MCLKRDSYFPFFWGTEESRAKSSRNTRHKKGEAKKIENGNIAAQTFTFRELAAATKNFRQECLIGEGGFGRVYKGKIASTGQVIMTANQK